MQEILELSVAERILIMEKIWDSIDPTTIAIPTSHAEELDRRLERHAKGETSFVSWADIKAELNSSK